MPLTRTSGGTATAGTARATRRRCPPAPTIAVRKVEIHDAYDLERWWWKANDGIRETTWPGVYNRSRLPGRNDYFTLPDWDCYVDAGKAVTFTLPDEPGNQIEIPAPPRRDDAATAARSSSTARKGEERSFNHLATPLTGGKIRSPTSSRRSRSASCRRTTSPPGAEPRQRNVDVPPHHAEPRRQRSLRSSDSSRAVTPPDERTPCSSTTATTRPRHGFLHSPTARCRSFTS